MNATFPYYTAAGLRELDRIAIEDFGIPGFTLMQRAGAAAFRALREFWPTANRVLVFCGTGNNGGDGFVIAGLAMDAGFDAEVYLAGKESALKGDARKALAFARARKVPVHALEDLPHIEVADIGTILVDALLGIGLKGKVRPPYDHAIDIVNGSTLPVLAVDVPSGLCSDTGAILGACVKADLTVTFIGRKLGMMLGEGPRMCGELVCDDLDIPAEVYARVEPARK